MITKIQYTGKPEEVAQIAKLFNLVGLYKVDKKTLQIELIDEKRGKEVINVTDWLILINGVWMVFSNEKMINRKLI